MYKTLDGFSWEERVEVKDVNGKLLYMEKKELLEPTGPAGLKTYFCAKCIEKGEAHAIHDLHPKNPCGGCKTAYIFDLAKYRKAVEKVISPFSR
jgi:hypothetical protein